MRIAEGWNSKQIILNTKPNVHVKTVIRRIIGAYHRPNTPTVRVVPTLSFWRGVGNRRRIGRYSDCIGMNIMIYPYRIVTIHNGVAKDEPEHDRILENGFILGEAQVRMTQK